VRIYNVSRQNTGDVRIAAKSLFLRRQNRNFTAERAIQMSPSAANPAADGKKYRCQKARESSLQPYAARCGKEAKVPFEPKSDRPVYCSAIGFAQNEGRKTY
jgi:CxxC-x17-CxxC domain-containing protein